MISLHQLKTFLAVAASGSVREAADTLVVSQPAVSAALAGLQRDVGAPLVARNGRGLVLTAAGEQLAVYGRRVFALLDEGLERTRECADASRRRLRLAAVTTAAEYLAPELLQRFREFEPAIEVELEVGNHSRVWDRLGHWEVDVVLAGRPPSGAPFRTIATRDHRLIVIAPAGRTYDVDALAQTTWLVREPGSGTRAATEDLFSLMQIDPPRLTIGSNGAIQACVRAGLGVSLASGDAVDGELSAGTLQAVATPLTPLARSWHLVTSSDRALSEAAARFAAFVADAAKFVLAGSGATAPPSPPR